MELAQLRVFLAIHHTGSFNQAARILHISQPAVSQIMRHLEQELGTRLYVRGSARATLTPEGRRLLPLAQELTELAERVRSSFARGRAAPPPCVRLSSGYLVGKYVVPQLLAGLRQRFPNTEIQFTVDSYTGFSPALRRGEADIVLSFRPEDGAEGCREPLLQDRLSLAAPPEHPWTRRGSLSLDDLTEYPILVPQCHTATRDEIEAALNRLQLGGRVRLQEIANMEVAFEAAERGLGATFVSSLAWPRLCRDSRMKIIPVSQLQLSRTLYVLWRNPSLSSDTQMTLVVAAIKEILSSRGQPA